jgi:hypothetical membrane protein
MWRPIQFGIDASNCLSKSNNFRSSFSPILRLAALAGMVGPVLFVLVFTVDGFLYPAYSPLDRTISYLGATGPSAWIQNANFVVFGVLLLIFGSGFYAQMRQIFKSMRMLKVSTIFLSLTGVGFLMSGLFTTESSLLLHNIGFTIIFSSAILAFAISGWQLSKSAALHRYGRYSIGASFATLVLTLVFFHVSSSISQIAGLAERILIIETITWDVVMGYKILRLGL